MGLAGTAAWADDEVDYRKLAATPKTADDHRALARCYRAIALENENQAKTFVALAAQYQKGLPAVAEDQVFELARALRHAAEHSRDFAEALNDLAEVHEGIAEGPVGG